MYFLFTAWLISIVLSHYSKWTKAENRYISVLARSPAFIIRQTKKHFAESTAPLPCKWIYIIYAMNFEVTVIKNNCFSIVINKNNVINVHVYVSVYTQCKSCNICYTEFVRNIGKYIIYIIYFFSTFDLKSFLIILKYPLSFIRFSVSMSVIFWLIFHDIFSFVFFFFFKKPGMQRRIGSRK